MLKRISFSSGGDLGFSLPPPSAHLAKDGGTFLVGTKSLREKNSVNSFLKEFFLRDFGWEFGLSHRTGVADRSHLDVRVNARALPPGKKDVQQHVQVQHR